MYLRELLCFLLQIGQCKGFIPKNCTMNAFPSVCTVLVASSDFGTELF